MKASILLVPGLLAATVGAAQSFAVTGLLPARNATAAPRATNVSATFSQPLGAAGPGAIRVFSSQRGGLLAGTATVSSNTLTFDPARDFRPGELVQATVTTAARSSGGTPLSAPQVAQFRAAAQGGTGVFNSGSEVATGKDPLRVALADIDNDGDLDLLSPHSNGNAVSVRLNNGAGVFAGTAEVPVGAGPLTVATGDLDGDGDLDFLTADANGGGSVSVRLNNGSGVFSVPAIAANGTIAVESSPQVVTTADVDGDGDLDMLVTNYNGSVSVRLNNGAGVFGGGSQVSVSASCVGLAVGDADNDGDLDIFATSFEGAVSIRLNNGVGIFSGTGGVAVGKFVVGLALGDLDGDGDLDLLVADGTSGVQTGVQVRLNDGRGTFSNGPDVLTNGLTTQALVAADVDGDGDLDMLTAANNSAAGNELGVWLNNGSAQFSRGSTTSLGPSYLIGLAVADVDNDGDLDCIGSLGMPAAATTGTVSIRLNNGRGPALAAAQPQRPTALQLYPNPAHAEARLQVPAGTREVVVLNALGQRLRVVAVPAHETAVLVPLRGLPAGVYTVRAGAAAGRLVVR